MEKKKKSRSKKQVIFLVAAGYSLGIVGYLLLFIPVLLGDEHGHYERGWIFAGMFFLLEIVAIIILVTVMPDVIALDEEKRRERAEKKQEK